MVLGCVDLASSDFRWTGKDVGAPGVWEDNPDSWLENPPKIKTPRPEQQKSASSGLYVPSELRRARDLEGVNPPELRTPPSRN